MGSARPGAKARGANKHWTAKSGALSSPGTWGQGIMLEEVVPFSGPL